MTVRPGQLSGKGEIAPVSYAEHGAVHAVTLEAAVAVLIVDDTGFLKKGVRSAGVQRQHSDTAGRTENHQVGVFLAYAAERGRTLIDRRLYLPTSWTDDRERCKAAGVSDDVTFETKVVIAKAMVRRAITEKIPFRWVTADAAYGFS